MDWFLLATAGSCGVVLLWTSRTARVRHAHNLNLIMERRVLESFAGLDATLSMVPALPTEMPPDRRRKFVVIEGGKARTPGHAAGIPPRCRSIDYRTGTGTISALSPEMHKTR
jgi:hypothetical protein